MKRVLTIQDISCLGKCSITITLPIISAMGVETTILPTAVLSTHTMFPGFKVKDLTDQLRPIVEHWKSEGVEFDDILIDASYPEDNLPTRKPGIGMMGKYLTGDYDLANSYVIGDRATDAQLAKNLGC